MAIVCQICNQEFEKLVSSTHLKFAHNISSSDYKKLYGNLSLASDDYRASRSADRRGENNPMFGKKHGTEAKNSISQKNAGRTASTKGQKITDATKLANIRDGHKRREASYKITGHPRQGAVLSDETKSKISGAVSRYAANNADQLTARAKKILDTKRMRNYDFGSSMRGRRHSNDTKERISKSSKLVAERKHQDSVLRWLDKIKAAGITLLAIDHGNATLQCDQCANVFNRTTQYFTNSKFSPEMCGICYPPPTKSQAELELLEYVRSITSEMVISGNRSLIFPLELDIYIPTLQIAIEYCGLWWHSELAGKYQSYHITKHDLCANAGARLITVFEDEWINRNEIVKSRLRSIISKSAEKIYARKCELRPISNQIARQFCANHHLQGAGSSRIAYGLYYNTVLVSVMTFTLPSIAKGNRVITPSTWELNRFCTIPNTIITGGASRLFRAFTDQHQPNQVISYSDLRWNTGNVYNQLGFKHGGRTPPGYWYFSLPNLVRTHRFALRKNPKDDANKTEWENRQDQGYNRIWDCGHDRWSWSK